LFNRGIAAGRATRAKRGARARQETLVAPAAWDAAVKPGARDARGAPGEPGEPDARGAPDRGETLVKEARAAGSAGARREALVAQAASDGRAAPEQREARAALDRRVERTALDRRVARVGVEQRVARLRREGGTTLVEVVVSVALLAIFTVATASAVTSGAATSADNRARVGASALGQREMEYSSQIITTQGSQRLRQLGVAGTEVNPHLTAELQAGSAATGEYQFKLDGVLYRVERSAALWPASEGSACQDASVGKQTIWGTLVTVTVSWSGMGKTTRPHVVKQVFPPGTTETLLTDPAKALIAVKVTGVAGSGSGLRQGVKVQVGGLGAPSAVHLTTQKGCAVFEVAPPPGGAEYEVRLLGGPSGVWVDGAGAHNPAQTVALEAGQSKQVPFEAYDQAARLEVTVVNAPSSVGAVTLEPAAGVANTHAQLIDPDTRQAVFEHVYPGTYFAKAGDASQMVELAPGSNKAIELAVS
jgi:hypothetical protein